MVCVFRRIFCLLVYCMWITKCLNAVCIVCTRQFVCVCMFLCLKPKHGHNQKNKTETNLLKLFRCMTKIKPLRHQVLASNLSKIWAIDSKIKAFSKYASNKFYILKLVPLLQLLSIHFYLYVQILLLLWFEAHQQKILFFPLNFWLSCFSSVCLFFVSFDGAKVVIIWLLLELPLLWLLLCYVFVCSSLLRLWLFHYFIDTRSWNKTVCCSVCLLIFVFYCMASRFRFNCVYALCIHII